MWSTLPPADRVVETHFSHGISPLEETSSEDLCVLSQRGRGYQDKNTPLLVKGLNVVFKSREL